ncbi:hypothetical protein RHMOL_Rhmol07G0124600 [Rhododendron molle]|uniref:Uncharacterized protein n=1 Tax=Rhododendron molle TaxID=49168 RepID=A0ACC0N1C6_RHOML|nr:hypothetical protein RHMOL_Rhmol07G0124600 [Rhododendron molle]
MRWTAPCCTPLSRRIVHLTARISSRQPTIESRSLPRRDLIRAVECTIRRLGGAQHGAAHITAQHHPPILPKL